MKNHCWLLFILFLLVSTNVSVRAQAIDELVLSDIDIRYDVNANSMPAFKGVNTTTNHPEFAQSQQYWLYIPIRNATNLEQWVLHISGFATDPQVWMLNEDANNELANNELATNELKANEPKALGMTPMQSIAADHVNTLGRAFALQLTENKNHVIVVELSAADHLPPPDISLMSEGNYKAWSLYLDYQYKVAIGITLGLIFIALMFSMVLRDVMFFWFSVSSTLLLLFFLAQGQIGFEFIASTGANPQWFWVLTGLSQTSILLLARYFLFVDSKADPLLVPFKLAIFLSAGAGVFGFFLPSTWNMALFSSLGVAVACITIYGTWVKSKSTPYYWFFMLAWTPTVFSLVELVVTLLLASGSENAALATHVIRDSYLHIVHMLILFVAMLMRILELKKQKYKVDIRNEAKSQFLATVSQDLNQPLQSMGSQLEQLESYISSETGQELYQNVFRLHCAMNDSFSTIMSLSQLNHGGVTLNRKNISLATLFEKLHLEYSPIALSKGIYFRVRKTTHLVNTDPVLLERILRNLISNAIKYTDSGGVLLACRTRRNRVLVQVWDTGCGISTADQATIFELYKRSSAVMPNKQGMGIGLAVVKHLADDLAHPIKVTSIEYRGSKFEIQLPLADVKNG